MFKQNYIFFTQSTNSRMFNVFDAAYKTSAEF